MPVVIRKQNVGEHKPFLKENPGDCKCCSEAVRKVSTEKVVARHKAGVRRSRIFFSKCGVYLCLDSKKTVWHS